MERESALEAIYEDDGSSGNEKFESDVEMVDASEETHTEDGELLLQNPQFNAPENDLEKIQNNSMHVKKGRNCSKRRSKKNRNNANSIGNINRYVIDTCRQLKEPKSYLVWEAIRKLGVNAVKTFVEEVFTIESHGGQMTADGKRRRTPGGILWNTLKSQEPEAYKEIMLKGKDFEKQLRKVDSKGRAPKLGRQPNSKRNRMGLGDSVSNDGDQVTERTCGNFSVPCKDGQPDSTQLENSLQDPLVKAWVDGIRTSETARENGCKTDSRQQTRPSEKVKLSVKDRIRVPVSYDDLVVQDNRDNEVKKEENGHLQDAI